MLGLRRALVLVCLSACSSEVEQHRELGRDIDVPVDLPPDDGFGHFQGSFAPCNEAPACVLGPSVRGEVVVTSALDIEALDGVRCLYGPLTIAATDLEDVSGLEALEFVCGVLTITDNPYLADTSGLQALSAVSTIEVRGNPSLVNLDLPALDYVENELRIEQHATLELVGLDALRSARLVVIENASLTSVRLPSFESGNIYGSSNPSLVEMDAPSLRAAEDITFLDSDALARLGLPALEEANRISIGRAAAFTTLDAPVLHRLEYLVLALLTDVPHGVVPDARLACDTEDEAVAELSLRIGPLHAAAGAQAGERQLRPAASQVVFATTDDHQIGYIGGDDRLALARGVFEHQEPLQLQLTSACARADLYGVAPAAARVAAWAVYRERLRRRRGALRIGVVAARNETHESPRVPPSHWQRITRSSPLDCRAPEPTVRTCRGSRSRRRAP